MASTRIITLLLLSACAANLASAADPYKPPLRLLYDHRHTDVAPDANSVQTTTAKMHILDAGVIQSLGQQALSYSEELQKLEVTEAYTLKADGSKIPVLPDAIITQQRPGTANAPGASDMKQKLIIFPNVEVGDTIVSTRTLSTKPMIPGLFYSGNAFPLQLPIDDTEIVYVMPKSLPLYIDGRDVKVDKVVSGDSLTYTIKFKTTPDKPYVNEYVSAFDRAPWYDVSTFKNWSEFAKAYAPMVASKLVVTPKIQAKADELTVGITDKREQVQRLYEWVANHIRYVALEFGSGGIVPHDPEAVLANAYGDCKDHSALLSALLKAKGIASELVLINAGDVYTVPNVPVIPVFNHMINYVPSLSLYVDSTQHSFALGTLPWTEYGKTVVHLGGSGDPVHKIGVLNQKDFTFQYTEHQILDASGKLIASGRFVAKGIGAGFARRAAASIKANGPEKTVGELLDRRGLSGASGAFSLGSLEKLTPDYEVTTHYTAPNQQSWLNGTSFTLHKGLTIDPLNSEWWMGPIAMDKYKDTETLPCLSMSGSEDYSLEIPAGKKLVKLPSDADVSADGLSYTAHWSQSGQTVSVHRTLQTHFSDALCRGPQRKAIGLALAKIKTDLGVHITLTQ